MHFLMLTAAAFALQFSAERAQAQGSRGAEPGDFDYYILTLSWSPTYCESNSEDDRQCGGARPYAFVLHGLWPQYEREGWPEMCRTRERPWVPQSTIDSMLDIMPSPRLVIHEYRQHGTCSGLSPQAYFREARRLYESIRIPERFVSLSQPLTLSPDEIKAAFLKANPHLGPDMVEVGCSRDRLREVRVCFSKDLKPRNCGEGELRRRLCRSPTVTLPPVRGGGAGPRGGPSGI
jgi:ribonuclease T2